MLAPRPDRIRIVRAPGGRRQVPRSVVGLGAPATAGGLAAAAGSLTATAVVVTAGLAGGVTRRRGLRCSGRARGPRRRHRARDDRRGRSRRDRARCCDARDHGRDCLCNGCRRVRRIDGGSRLLGRACARCRGCGVGPRCERIYHRCRLRCQPDRLAEEQARTPRHARGQPDSKKCRERPQHGSAFHLHEITGRPVKRLQKVDWYRIAIVLGFTRAP